MNDSRPQHHGIAHHQDLMLLVKATAFAADKHSKQRRKNAEKSPYINHPIAVASILCNEAHVTDINVLCSALLHDTVEDTYATHEELTKKFGQEIAWIVEEVTDDKLKDKEERKQLQIEHAGDLSIKAKLVKLADKISNLRDVTNDPPTDWDLKRKRDYFDWAKQVVDRVRGVHPPLEALFDQAYEQRP